MLRNTTVKFNEIFIITDEWISAAKISLIFNISLIKLSAYKERHVRACVRACVRAGVRACVRACVCVCVWHSR